MRLHLHIPLLVFLLVNTAPADANLLARSSESLARAVNRVHRRAAKRSTGLARDLRRAFSGMLYDQELVAANSQKVYCVPGSSLTNSGANGSGSNGTSDSSASSSPSSTASSRSSGAAQHSSTASGPAPTSSGGSTPSSPWKIFKSYQGETFFDGWDFFTGNDPTNGNVDYVSRNDANSSNLIEINSDGHAIMRVETTPQVATANARKSVRITTTDTYTGALVVLDAVHMPTGCATWPAFWSNGPDWPNGGEIDIVEGVNENADNQATIHTSHGCTIPSSDSSVLKIQGSVVGGTNCAAAETGNAGCGMVASQSNTYGVGFNNNGGGVYAMQWVDSGISVWFFPRKSIPSDISSGAPLPDGWGTPMAHWPASSCNPSQFFHDHSAIFDTTLCGDWAGNVWNSGGDSSCAAKTKVSTCTEYVQNNGAAFNDAYWEVNYVKVFQT